MDGLVSTQSFSKMSFYRLQKILGLIQGGFSTGITYEMFSKGYGIFAVDFSASLSSCQQLILPTIRGGHARLSVEFDSVTTKAYHLLSLLEYPSNITISIGAQGRVIQVIKIFEFFMMFQLQILIFCQIIFPLYFKILIESLG